MDWYALAPLVIALIAIYVFRKKLSKGKCQEIGKLLVDLIMVISERVKNKQEESPIEPPSEPPDDIKILPYPEEKPDSTQTLETIDAFSVINEWLVNYEVPREFWGYWQSAIDIQVYEIYPDWIVRMGITQDIPALTWEDGGKRHLAVKSAWLNPGIIAHEQAHNSYALLPEQEKADFSAIYMSLKTTAPLIKLLYSINSYGLTNDVEGHAEVYRYLGGEMPPQLKKYYPKLIM